MHPRADTSQESIPGMIFPFLTRYLHVVHQAPAVIRSHQLPTIDPAPRFRT